MIKTRFITLTNHRSGSSHFLRLLDSHPKIRARQELLRKKEARTKDFLDDLFYSSRIAHKIFGFKLMYTHVSPEVEEFMREYKCSHEKCDDVKVIQLIRRDLLETALWYRAHFEGEAEGGMGPRLVVNSPVTAKIPSVIHQMKETKANIDKYRPLADFTVYYDDFTTPDGTQEFRDKVVRRELLEFLGAEDYNLYSEANIKNIRPHSSEIVTNWEELVAAVKSAGLEKVYNG